MHIHKMWCVGAWSSDSKRKMCVQVGVKSSDVDKKQLLWHIKCCDSICYDRLKIIFSLCSPYDFYIYKSRQSKSHTTNSLGLLILIIFHFWRGSMNHRCQKEMKRIVESNHSQYLFRSITSSHLIFRRR